MHAATLPRVFVQDTLDTVSNLHTGAQDAKQAVQGLQAALEAAHRDLASVQISASGQGQQHLALQTRVHDLQSQLAASQAALLQTQVLTGLHSSTGWQRLGAGSTF